MIRKNLIIAILCVFTFQALQAQMPGEKSYLDESVMPGGKKGERIKSLIATANSNDPDQIRRFMSEERTKKFQNIAPMEEHISVFLGFRRATGGVDFHSIRTYVPERKETVVILKDRNFDSWRAFSMTFDKSEDLLVAGIYVNIARTPSNVKESPLTEAKCLQTITAQVRLPEKSANCWLE
jgi:hypothetical protein